MTLPPQDYGKPVPMRSNWPADSAGSFATQIIEVFAAAGENKTDMILPLVQRGDVGGRYL